MTSEHEHTEVSKRGARFAHADLETEKGRTKKRRAIPARHVPELIEAEPQEPGKRRVARTAEAPKTPHWPRYGAGF